MWPYPEAGPCPSYVLAGTWPKVVQAIGKQGGAPLFIDDNGPAGVRTKIPRSQALPRRS